MAETGTDGPAGALTLYRSERTRVMRVPTADGAAPLIRKEMVGPDAAARSRHERRILARLAGLPGVVELVAEDGEALLLRDTGGTVLSALARPDPAGLITLASALASTLAGVHERGVAHRDLNPANIVVSESGPTLIDFDLATTFATERRAFTHQNRIAGTLPYLPPEQTGRTGHPIDHRADLYSLGATLYELATGAPPFGVGDALRLVHDHLARVPRPPTEVNPAVGAALSAIILRLLEKEPERRYQSALGLLHDLRRVTEGATFTLGEHDFPRRLAAPSRLVGRDRERTVLRDVFEAVRRSDASGREAGLVVISGAAGVGKTRLADELRPATSAAGGWYVAVAFDQHQRTDAVRQALTDLGRLLLADAETEVTAARDRLQARLGDRAGLVTATIPELAVLLDGDPDAVPTEPDPRRAQAQLVRAWVDVLRALASPHRPIVLVLDDLHLAGPTPLAFVDALGTEPGLPGVLLVAIHRSSGVDPAHPLTPVLDRWRRLRPDAPHLPLSDLPAGDVADLLSQMLRMPSTEITDLADAVRDRTGGNPVEAIEFLNELRHEGAVVLADDGWRWDLARARNTVGGVLASLTARIDALPGPTDELLTIVGVLDGEVDRPLLEQAAGLPPAELEERLFPVLSEGLLAHDADRGTVRFVHERVRDAVLGRVDAPTLDRLRLTVARRLATAPEMVTAAATQYLPVLDAVQDPVERQSVAALYRHAAERASALGAHELVDRFLCAAESLTGRTVPLAIARHRALYCLTRLEEGDRLYAWITAHAPDPLDRAAAAAVQVAALGMRMDTTGSLALGLATVRELGLVRPERVDVEGCIERAYRWLDEGEADAAELADPRLRAIALVSCYTMPGAFYHDQATMMWLVVECVRIWIEHGPAPALVTPVCNLMFLASELRADYRIGYRLIRRVMAVADARRYDTAAEARFLYALTAQHWFEPPEEVLRQARAACEGLLHGGDPLTACFSYLSTLPAVLESAPTLDDVLAEADVATGLAARSRLDQAVAEIATYRRLVGALTGAAEDRPDADASTPASVVLTAVREALAVAILDWSALPAATEAYARQFALIGNGQLAVTARLLRTLALIGTGEEPTERDAGRGWLVDRAADAPDNVGHLVHFVEAEARHRAGDHPAAIAAYDAALRGAATRSRPWQHALIAERAGRAHLAAGLDYTGRFLLADARDRYAAWGATAKVAALDSEFGRLRGVSSTARPASIGGNSVNLSGDAVDMLGVLRASQTLASETDLDRLRERVADVLGAMTGATAVHIVLWSDESGAWVLPTDAEHPACALDDDPARRRVPVSAVRYADRTDEPLVVDDACRDGRFARDPYVAGREHCSLLVLPLRHRGDPQAILVLANTLSQSAFTHDRLDVVQLVTGQLAVSFANARLYASLESKVAVRTAELADANERLEQLSVTDPLTGLANRRRLIDTLDAEWLRALRPRTSLAVALVDVDHFKLFNDHYGHSAGDTCLRAVAEALRTGVRATDLVARYGGEEFVVVMPETDGPDARRVAERLLTAIAERAVPHAQAPRGIVTVSIGVAAVVPGEGGTAQALVDAADERLYAAKDAGRNRVES